MTKEEANKHFLEEELNLKGTGKGHEDTLAFINDQGEPAKDGEWMGIAKGMAKYAMQFPSEDETTDEPVEEPEKELETDLEEEEDDLKTGEDALD